MRAMRRTRQRNCMKTSTSKCYGMMSFQIHECAAIPTILAGERAIFVGTHTKSRWPAWPYSVCYERAVE